MIWPSLTQSSYQNMERNKILTTRCVTPKVRTFDSCLDHNDNLMVKNSASLQVLIWGLYQRWPNRVADLLCSLERKVGLPSSPLSYVWNHQGKGFGRCRTLYQVDIEFYGAEAKARLKLRTSSLLTFVRQSTEIVELYYVPDELNIGKSRSLIDLLPLICNLIQ